MSADVALPEPAAAPSTRPGAWQQDEIRTTPRVILHVGLPKTATTYLQHRLRLNTATLASHGVRMPLDRPWSRPYQLCYRAALDLRGMRHGLTDREVAGRWERLVKRVRRTGGVRIVSHELFAGATREQARRALDELAGHEVHVVVTARELGRQLAGGWQEALKHGKSGSFEDYLQRGRAGRLPMMRSFDLPRVFDVWGGHLEPERLHLVTVPRVSAGRDEVWTRFATAAGIDPAWAPHEPTQANASVTVEQAQLLRALNDRLGPIAARGGRYATLIESVVAGAAGTGGHRIELPARHEEWVARRTERAQEWVRARGVQVHGALGDLDPVARGAEAVDPDQVDGEHRHRAGVDAIVALLEESYQRRRVTWHLRRQEERLRSYLHDTFGR